MHSAAELAVAETEALQAGPAQLQLGNLTPEAFRALRVRHGIYEQRQPEAYLLRIRVPAGRVTCAQLNEIGRLALAHDVRRIHVTTRQNLQLHDLSLPSALQIQGALADLGFASLGSGGNTVRNITADPLSGVADDEQFDIGPYALALGSFLSGSSHAAQLHRKFKIAISSSGRDRAGATTADLGFLAERRQGSPGFRVFAAGGLGVNSTLGVELIPWIAADAVAQVTEGVLAMFVAMGAHPNRRKARLRHLRHRLGDTEFLRLCREAVRCRATEPLPILAYQSPHENQQVSATALASPWIACDGIRVRRQDGSYSVRLAPMQGDLTPTATLALARAAVQFGSVVVRIGLDQEFWITGVGGAKVGDLIGELSNCGLGTPAERRQLIVACSGAATCRLGVLDARAAASAVAARLHQCQRPACVEAIRMSGCPNACGRHLVAGLGFSGRSVRVGHRHLPSYDVFVGGNLGLADPRLGSKVATIAAKRLPEFVAALARLGSFDTLSEVDEIPPGIQAIIADHSLLPPTIPDDWFSDWVQRTE